MARLGIAAGNQLGADAAVEVARAGGNAVDACLAAAVMGWVAEPFYASMAGSGFIAVRTPGGAVEIIDGNSIMPFTPPPAPGKGLRRVYLEYSNGMYTGVGGGAVAVPGVLAAVSLAWERHGSIPWEALFAPAIRAAREGMPFPRSSAYYLHETWERIWSSFPAAAEIFGRRERPLIEGDHFVQPALADSLELVASKGAAVFYEGELAEEIAKQIAADGGFFSVEDLQRYTAEVRAPVTTDAFGWHIESNPPPAVGGAVLTHMLALLAAAQLDEPLERLRAIIEAESAAMGYRRENYADPGQIAGALEEALGKLARQVPGAMRSPSTTHASAADADGFVCSITESNGYGAGLVVNGILLNNTLGEEELNPLGAHRLPPGSRCHSNMAPTIATGPDGVVGLGSPGADRIVGAIAQTLMGLAEGLSLEEAVVAPRAHLARKPEGELLCFEPGLPGDAIEGYTPRPYEEIHMFFGAVQAASVTYDGSVEAVFDPRRSGASALV